MGKVLGVGCAGLDPVGEASGPPIEFGDPFQPALIPRPTLLCFPGLSAHSPLGGILAAATAGQVQTAFTGGAAPARWRWRRLVGGTALRWWLAERMEPTGGGPVGGLTVDLHGSAQPGQGRRWRVVDGSGVPLLAAFHALQCCHRAPFIASLYLIEDDAGDVASAGPPHVLAQAHVSSSRRYSTLLDALGHASGQLIRTALRGRASAAPRWAGMVGPRRRAMPLARSRVAGAAAWLRDRVGGDLYGIAVLRGGAASLLRDAVVAPSRWAEIPGRHGFIADPFFWPGRPGVVLCEWYSHAMGRGHLTAIALDRGPGGPVLIADHHLSYPFTFMDGDRTFCLPEMAAARRQVLYEVREGEALSPVCVVAEDVAMADPTLMRHEGLYWISYTDAAVGDHDNLCLMFAERLSGPWRAHPGNPVKIDIRSSRPGGTPFWVEGRLYRPAQDCSRTYGGAVVINLVRSCTPQSYEECAVATLRADPGGRFPDGVHTLALDGEQILIDGKRISYHPAILWQKVRRRLPWVHRQVAGDALPVVWHRNRL